MKFKGMKLNGCGQIRDMSSEYNTSDYISVSLTSDIKVGKTNLIQLIKFILVSKF